VFSSVTPDDLPNGLLKNFLEYANGLIIEPTQIDHFDSNFEREVAETLRSIGLTVWTQYEAAGFKIDLVVGYGEEFVAVECDGPTHFDIDEKAPYHDVWRQEILERAGWRFIRISYRDWEKNRSSCVERIMNSLHLTFSTP
jgi:very-short-patch-repair endonuclease